MKKTFTLCISLVLVNFISAQYQFEDNCLGYRLKMIFPDCITSGVGVYTLDTLCPEVLNAETLHLDGPASCNNISANDMQYFRSLKTLSVYWDVIGENGVPFYVPPTVVNLVFEGINVISAVNQPIAYPEGLKSLRFDGCKILNTGVLPDKLKSLEFDLTNYMLYNDSMRIVNIPDSLEFLTINDMNTDELIFPDAHNAVKMDSFYLKTYEINYHPELISNLPSSLRHMRLEWDEMDSLPALPGSLQSLYVNTLITSWVTFHSFPDQLRTLKIVGDVTCLPPYPQSLEYLSIVTDEDYCHPNYIPNIGMEPNLCSSPYYNEQLGLDCNVYYKTIMGNVYHDLSQNCEFSQAADLAMSQVPVVLYDGDNNFIQKVYSQADGIYVFSVPDGEYKVMIDTNECNLRKSCSAQQYSYEISVNDSSSHQVQNFELACDTIVAQNLDNFDLSVHFANQSRPAVPSFDFDLLTVLKNSFYNEQLNCSILDTADLNGNVPVETKVLGPVVFMEADTSLNISQTYLGDTLLLSFNITMSEMLDFFDYKLRFRVDTNADFGDLIFVQTQITPPGGDLDVANNKLVKIFEVRDSFDPNMKETYPFRVQPGFDGEIRYTIHFQNTGNSPAINVKLVDTLDQQLDLTTFRKVHSSHPVSTTLNGNRLQFQFMNINLTDSLSDPEGSKGYVEYAIRPKNPMQLDEKIFNTAYIYFDFNEPIVTNTSENWCTTISLGLEDAEQVTGNFVIYPNPLGAERLLKLRKKEQEKSLVTIYDLNGAAVGSYNLAAGENEFDLRKLKAGIYILRSESDSGVSSGKLVVL